MKSKFIPDTTNGQVLNVLCTSCHNSTNHKVLNSVHEEGSEEWDHYYDVHWTIDYQIIQCQGCDRVSFRSNSIHSEYRDEEDRLIHTELVYPKRNKHTRFVKNFANVPYNLQRIYKETVECYNNSNNTLCGAGVRSIVEGLCQEKVYVVR